jgi:hypothetical protein
MIKEYLGSHFYFGAIMISGHDIAKLELSTRPEEDTKEESKSKGDGKSGGGDKN